MRKHLVALAAIGSVLEPLACWTACAVLIATCIVQAARQGAWK